ncbi:MAG: putative ubiquitin-conjugating enzyme E2-16 kDa [Streblomastix strix]|uniref:Putative ubiquitin-conjugating enzyme E2-16 kDa n=1 Tax=Streblomastix strix TaxID=222440 RepID=A0A5J4VM22_9EUKA|nr:MAG: putative ubiquitin-conjugating enzyme E2-16 kDa [Streblomastix strix]
MQQKVLFRLQKELKELQDNPIPGVEVAVNKCDDFKPWEIIIDGPKGTLYEKGKFHLIVSFSPDYPFRAPQLAFKHKIYHVNVTQDGKIIQNEGLFESNWKPMSRIRDYIFIIIQMLITPESGGALDPDVFTKFRENRAEYDRKAREWTKLYAK